MACSDLPMTTTKVNFAHATTYNTTKYKEQLTRFGQFSYASCQIETFSRWIKIPLYFQRQKKGPFSVCTRTFLTSGADISSKIATTTSGTTLFTSFKSAAISLTEKLLGRVGFTTLCKPFWYGAITEIIPRSQRGESIFEWFDRETLPELYERKSNYQLTQSEIYEKLGSATINVRAHKLLIDKCLAKVFYVNIFMGGVAVPFGLSNYKGFNT